MSKPEMKQKSVQNPAPKGAGQSAARRSARLVAAQTLYQVELGAPSLDDALKDALARTGVMLDGEEEAAAPDLKAPDNKMVSGIVRGAWEKREQIDEMLRGALDAEWPPERLEAILRAILRAGAYELTMTKTPPALLITDYVDVTHAFYGGKEPGLVNAVLDRLGKALKS